MLPVGALEFLRDRIARGERLGRVLSRHLCGGDWNCWTVIPASAYLDPGHSYDEGGVANAAESRLWVSARINEWLQIQLGHIALFENDVARAGDSWLDRCRSRIAYSGARVLHYARTGDDASLIESAIREAQSSHVLIGALIDSHVLALEQGVSPDDFENLAGTIVGVICDAFDGESYIIAEPAGAPTIAR